MRARRASVGDREGLTIAAHAAGKLARRGDLPRGLGGGAGRSLAAANLAERAGDAHVDALGALGYAAGTLGLHGLAQLLFRPRASGRGGAPDRGGSDLARALGGLAARGGVAHGPRREGEGEGAHRRGDRAHALHRRPARRGLRTSVLAMLHWYDGRIDATPGRRRGGHGRPRRRRHVRQRAALIHTEAFAHLSGGDLPAAKAALATLGSIPHRADALVRSLNQAMQAAVHLGERRLERPWRLADEALRGVGTRTGDSRLTAVHLWEGTLEVFLAAHRAGIDRGGSRRRWRARSAGRRRSPWGGGAGDALGRGCSRGRAATRRRRARGGARR